MKTLPQPTDISRWESVAKDAMPSWRERSHVIASIIPRGVSVVDIGSGNCTLGSLLQCSRYTPVDITPLAGALVWDFNSDDQLEIEVHDWVVMSGCLEYATDPERVLRRCVRLGRNALFSFGSLRPLKKDHTNGWSCWVGERDVRRMAESVMVNPQSVKWRRQVIYHGPVCASSPA